MTREEMIAAVDGEIRRLEQIRGLLTQSHSERFLLPGNDAKVDDGKKKRILSPEARRRIGLAQKRRWAKQKRESALTSEAQS